MNFGLEVQVFLRQHKKIHSYGLSASSRNSKVDCRCLLPLAIGKISEE